MPTRLPDSSLLMALAVALCSLTACADDTDSSDAKAPAGEGDSEGSSDTADDGGTDTGSDADLVRGFAAGCLEDGCDFAAHAVEALEVCSAATGGADDTIVYWGDMRLGSAESKVWMTCSAEGLTEGDCPALCAEAGLGEPSFEPTYSQCMCERAVTTSTPLIEQLVGSICDTTTGAAAVQGQAGFHGDSAFAEIRCRGGAGGDTCPAAEPLLESELGLRFAFSTGRGDSCTYSNGSW